MLSEMSPRVLLVEDDDAIARPLIRTLEREGYAVERVDHGLAALSAAESDTAPHLMILDLGLPDIDGLEVCRRARDAGRRRHRPQCRRRPHKDCGSTFAPDGRGPATRRCC